MAYLDTHSIVSDRWVNPLMPFNPFVPKAHNSGRQNLIFPLQIKPAKVNLNKANWRIFIFFTPAPASMG